MCDEDFDDFAKLIDAVATLLRRPDQPPLNSTAKALYFRALSAHSLAQVRAGLDAHMRDPQRGRFFPLPADVIAQVEARATDDGRPGAEEAWALSLRSSDEAETVVWTSEMSEAWAIARPVLQAGDEVGARMAFREAYTRLVESARQQRAPVAWTASLGFDAQRREMAIGAAITAGRLPASELQALPAPDVDILRLGYEQASDGVTPAALQARERLRQLSEQLKARKAEPSEDAQARTFTESRKAETAERVSQYVERQTVATEVHA